MATKDITTKIKLEIPEHVSKANYENLNNILGTALPEVTESRYYSQTESERKTTITLKDLRHLIMWQLWITHFMDHYPNFHTEMEKSYENGTKFDQIGKLVFKKIGIESIKPEHLNIHNPKKPKEVSENAKKTKKYQNSVQAYEEEKKQMDDDFEKIKNLHADHRLEWYLQRTLERLANKKKEVLDLQDVNGHPNDTDGKLSNNIRHVLNFLTYISSTEEETRANIKLLNKLDPNPNNFIHLLRNINNLATIVSSEYTSKLLNTIKTWHKDDKLMDKWTDKYRHIRTVKHRNAGLNARRMRYIIKKHCYEQILQFLDEFGTNPPHNTSCITNHNKIFKAMIEEVHSGGFSKQKFQKDYLRGVQTADKWDACYCTADVFFNFVSWYLRSEIKKKTTDEFFKLIDKYLTDANNEFSANVENKESFKVKEFDIFEIGKALFENDTNSNLSIDNHLEDNDDSDENKDGESESQAEESTYDSNGEETVEQEREAITSLKDARDVHDVTMLLLHKLIKGLSDDKQRQEMSKVLQNMESLQGDTEIGSGQYDVDNVLKEFLGEENKDQD